jgi:hypothetical protein
LLEYIVSKTFTVENTLNERGLYFGINKIVTYR